MCHNTQNTKQRCVLHNMYGVIIFFPCYRRINHFLNTRHHYLEIRVMAEEKRAGAADIIETYIERRDLERSFTCGEKDRGRCN